LLADDAPDARIPQAADQRREAHCATPMAPSARCTLAIERTNTIKDGNFGANGKLIRPRASLLNDCSEFSSGSPGTFLGMRGLILA
jgi:hypothetical protein